MQTYLWVETAIKNSRSLDLERAASYEEFAAQTVSSPFVEHTRQLYKHAHQMNHKCMHHMVTKQGSTLRLPTASTSPPCACL